MPTSKQRRLAPPGTKNFTFIVEQERIYYCENGILLPQDIKGKKAERIKVMQRFLQPRLLQKLGLNFFNNWAATFDEVVSSLEITPEGSGYRMKSRFAKFHNLPELMSMFRLVMSNRMRVWENTKEWNTNL